MLNVRLKAGECIMSIRFLISAEVHVCVGFCVFTAPSKIVFGENVVVDLVFTPETQQIHNSVSKHQITVLFF